MASPSTETTLARCIDEGPISPRQFAIVALITAILMLDGTDLQLLAFVSPVMIRQWSVSKELFGIALSSALLSMAVGAYLGGKAGDRFGRKPVLTCAVILFGLGTLGTSYVEGVGSLVAMRLISGLGFGAASPNGLALSTEWMPLRTRGRVASLMYIAMALGGLFAGGLATVALPAAGWRACFQICGAITAVIAVLTILFVPESARYLASKGDHMRASAIFAKIMQRKVTEDQTVVPATISPGDATESLLSPHQRRFTIGIGLAFFAQAASFYALSSWLPVILTSFGFTVAAAVQTLLAFNIICLPGALLIDFALRRFGSRQVMMALIGLGTIVSVGLIAVSFVSHAGGTVPEALIVALLFSIAIIQAALASSCYILVSHGYPISLRGGGMGSAMMLSRLAGVLGIALGGVLLGFRASDSSDFFIAFTLAYALLLASMLVIDRHITARA